MTLPANDVKPEDFYSAINELEKENEKLLEENKALREQMAVLATEKEVNRNLQDEITKLRTVH